MPSIFQTRPGVAVAFPVEGDVPIPIAFDGWSGSTFPAFKSIITQLQVQRGVNHSILHTFQDLIYAYTFGERIGVIQLGGIAFADSCESGGGQPKCGIEYILEYYDENSLARRPSPLTIQLGTTPAGRFIGLLVDINVNIAQPEARMAQFTFNFRAFPQKKKSKSNRRPGTGGAANTSFTPSPSTL